MMKLEIVYGLMSRKNTVNRQWQKLCVRSRFKSNCGINEIRKLILCLQSEAGLMPVFLFPGKGRILMVKFRRDLQVGIS